jgi:hypothetical protein
MNSRHDNDDASFDAEISRLNKLVAARAAAQAELDRISAELGLSDAAAEHTSKTSKGNLAKRIASVTPVCKPVSEDVLVKPASSGLAQRIAQLVANKKPKPAFIKTIVNDNYADILAGYRAGASLVDIAKIMTEELGANIKHGSLRNYFLEIAEEKGDLQRRKRVASK